MKFKNVFKNKKPVIGMIHTGRDDETSMLDLAKKGDRYISEIWCCTFD